MDEVVAKIGYGEHLFIPLTDEEFAMVGKITGLFGQIEQYLDLWIMMLSGMGNISDFGAIAGGAPFGAKVKMLNALARSKKNSASPISPPCIILCAELEKAGPMRNKIVHGRWGIVSPDLHDDADQPHTRGFVRSRDGQQIASSDIAVTLEAANLCAKLTFEVAAAMSKPHELGSPLTMLYRDP